MEYQVKIIIKGIYTVEAETEEEARGTCGQRV